MASPAEVCWRCIHRPVRHAADVDGLHPVDPDALDYVYAAVRTAPAFRSICLEP